LPVEASIQLSSIIIVLGITRFKLNFVHKMAHLQPDI